MFPVVIARAIILRLSITARYEHGNTHCPVCGTVTPVKCCGDIIANCQTRYHECPGCGATFKSVGEPRPVQPEKTSEPATPQPIIDHHKGRKGRRR